MPGPWKAWKTKSGFPRFPPSLENLAKTARFSHFHRLGGCRLEKWKTNPRFSTFPPGTRDDDNQFPIFKPKTKERKSAATRPPHSSIRSPFVRAQTRFHAHPSIGKCSGVKPL